MKFGLLGYPLSHSMSGFIHKELFLVSQIKADYKMIECEKLDDKCLNKLKELDGFNVTIPYKNKIIAHLNKLDIKAQSFQSVNTVSVKEDMKGYNTDVDGFLDSVVKLNAQLTGDVLVLGAGGVARMVIYETASRGGKVSIAVRKKSFNKAQKLIDDIKKDINNCQMTIIDINNIEGSYDLVANCTPVGMYPDIEKSPIDLEAVKKCGAVVDLIYNPQRTRLLEIAQNQNKPCIGGMYMLVKQAAKAQEIWTGRANGDYVLEEIELKANIYMKRNFQKSNISFVGFMASGKTTLAKAFAKKLDMDFVDIDQQIEKREKMTIPQIFAQKGEKFFREREKEVIKETCQNKDTIISTGGGAIMDAENRKTLKNSGIIVYIDTPFDICLKRIKEEGNRPMADKKQLEKIKELYTKRAEVYQEAADIIVDGTKELDTKISEIMGYISL